MKCITRSFTLACALVLHLSGSVASAQQPAAADVPGSAPVAAAGPVSSALAPALQNVLLHTALGDIVIAVEIERAPLTAKNFLRYVDNKRFDGSVFYRGMKVTEDGKYAVVQAGLQGNSKLLFKAVEHEPTTVTGLSHVDGAVSMAMGAPGTATADFFIVIGDLVSMDAKADEPGYAVFGHVVSGMEVARAVLEEPKSELASNPVMKGQMLAQPVKIITARRAP
jgi:peptidyl-prolyl cis-trans isomerase A (cyclophilin A)